MNMENIIIHAVYINSCATYIGIEFIILCRQHHLSQVFADARYSGQVYSVVVEAKQLMNHCLICPLQREEYRPSNSKSNTVPNFKKKYTFDY